jgi:methyltransferase-like protein/cyclopropane fatty-acyl-phospholipid synthase-like methyltransferase
MSANNVTSYDVIPYPSYAFPQTHPDRLAVIATLLGLRPQPVERCRVLELGCAAGSNIIPMAEELPESTFLGIDLSQRQIEEGGKAIAELGLTNIELRHQSITAFDPGPERFDFLLCHGVYSWVPPEVQDRILDLCRQALQPNGIAYVSYNTLPGWHMRGMIRDMMVYHGQRFADLRQRVAEARSLLDFLVSSVPMEKNPYGQFLRSELENLRQQPDAYLAHEQLEEHNSPLYFHQFVEKASRHGLRYIADVNLHTMDPRNLPPQVGQALQRGSTDLVQMEQYMDFLRNRAFRQSLLCHSEQAPRFPMQPESLTGFFIGSPLRPIAPTPDLHSPLREDFRTPSGSTAFSIFPIVKASLQVLGEVWPESLPLEELCLRARARLGGEAPPNEATRREDDLQVRQALLRFCMIAPDLVEFRLRPLRITTWPGPRPMARPLARWQAQSGRPVINLQHEVVNLDDFGRRILPRLDGQHTREEITREVAALVEGGQMTIQEQGVKVTQPQRIDQVLQEALGKKLELFARQALLIA